MRSGRFVFLILAALTLLGACAQTPAWQAAHFQDHPLTGRIWNVLEAQYITRAQLFAALTSADYVLLGETHDNPDHHLLQAEIVTALTDAGRRPALAFEMFDVSQDLALKLHLAQFPGDVEGIAEAVGWNKSGWPDWSIYQPIAEAGLRATLSLQAASMDRSDARTLMRLGVAGAPPEQVQSLLLDRPLNKTHEDSLSQEIDDAHCGYAPKKMISAMAFAQFARDAHMAYRMNDSENKDGAILISGAGHSRNDRGVPFHLRRLAPSRSIASLAFIEVLEGENTTLSYGKYFGGAPLPFDFVWFTPRVDIRDPCERFEQQLKKMKSGE